MSTTCNSPEVLSPGALSAQLLHEPFRFEFYQAVRVLTRLDPARSPVGYDYDPAREDCRFRAHLSLDFPASEIQKIDSPPHPEGPPEVVVNFMGLTGPSGVLPIHYTELLITRSLRKDHALRTFLDLFNHRLISLFYRAWEKYRFFLYYERAELLGRQEQVQGPERLRNFILSDRPRLDPHSQVLLDLIGCGEPSLRYRVRTRRELVRRTSLDDETLRYYAGLFAQRHRSGIGLEGMLSDYFGVTVLVTQLVGQWLLLDPEDQSRLSRPGTNARLGVSAVAGERIWDVGGKFRATLGPMPYRQFRDFLPTGTAYRPLVDMISLYAGRHLDCDIELLLPREEVPRCRMGGDSGSLLGWETWPLTGPFREEVARIIFPVRNA
jgi:type VI secretion system protein ImpH